MSCDTQINIDKGYAKFNTNCVSCHGSDGKSSMEQYPNLKGQKRFYISKQLKEFKAGTRKDPYMNAIASTLTVEEIENLATYLSSQTCK